MLTKSRQTRKKRIRSKISGTTQRPRLSVFRSNVVIYAQIIDDSKGVTLAEAHGKKPQEVGAEVSEKAKAMKITEVVFDRGGYQYHGRVKLLAEAAREGGLKF